MLAVKNYRKVTLEQIFGIVQASLCKLLRYAPGTIICLPESNQFINYLFCHLSTCMLKREGRNMNWKQPPIITTHIRNSLKCQCILINFLRQSLLTLTVAGSPAACHMAISSLSLAEQLYSCLLETSSCLPCTSLLFFS